MSRWSHPALHRRTRHGLALLAMLLGAKSAQAQVGHPPDRSPYEDLRGRQAATLSLGVLSPDRDPAGVAPRAGLVVSGQYHFQLARPLWLYGNVSVAPRLERPVRDPLFSDAQREAGTTSHPLILGETGLLLNLTGNKSWYRIVPQLHGGIGFITDGGAPFDLGGYRVGTAFALSIGLGARVTTGGPYEVYVDLSRLSWKVNYPDIYGYGTTPLVSGGRLGPWVGGTRLQLGVSRFFFR